MAPYFPDDAGEAGERIARGEDGKNYYVPADMKYSDWKEKFVADAAKLGDIEQFNRYKEVLKEYGPQTIEEFIDFKYSDAEKWDGLKKFHKYKSIHPVGTEKDYELNKRLKAEKLITGVVAPYKWERANILEDLSTKRDPAHIMKRMLERHITDDDVQKFIDNALFMENQWSGTRRVYYSEKGITVLTKTEDYPGIEWIAKTTWNESDFDDRTLKIFEVAK